MKFNWGHGITIFITLFMIAVLSAVYYTSTQRIELVTPDYYQQEIGFQKVIDANENSELLQDSIQLAITSEFVEISFASTIEIKNAQGNIVFYRPNNLELDKQFEVEKFYQNNVVRIPKSDLVSGRYEVSIKWKKNNLDYIWEKSISL